MQPLPLVTTDVISSMSLLVSSWYTTEWFDISIYLRMVTMRSLVMMSHYIKIIYNYWLYSPVHFISMTHLFCNWELVPLKSPHLFLSLSHPPSLWPPPVCSLYLWLCFCFVTFVHFFSFWISPISEIIQYSSFSDLFHLEWCTWGPSKLSKMARFLSLLWPHNIALYIPYLLYSLIYWWVLWLLPYLGYCK